MILDHLLSQLRYILRFSQTGENKSRKDFKLQKKRNMIEKRKNEKLILRMYEKLNDNLKCHVNFKYRIHYEPLVTGGGQ